MKGWRGYTEKTMTSVCILVLLAAAGAPAQAEPARAKLPQDHDYQRQLRAFMASLKEADFEHGVAEQFSVPAVPDDPEEQYRTWLLTLNVQPVLGSKRGYPSVNAPPRLFLLSSIEGGEAIMQPPVWPTPLAWLVTWDYAGNPYHNSRALKLRAFVNMCVDLMMLDHQLETTPEKGGNRTDWFAPHLITYAYPYVRLKDVLPPDVRRAYETGLRKMARRVLDWGLKGEEPNLDAFATIGLLLASQALADPSFTAGAEAFVRDLLADPEFFHPAGYFVDQGGLDVEFAGMAAFALTWTVLAGDWQFAREAVERWYRLAAHLSLPEPDGSQVGPSHFNSRTGGDVWPGQWDWVFRDYGGAMVTDEAAHLTKRPTAEELKAAFGGLAGKLNAQVRENPRVKGKDGKWRFQKNEELQSHPWQFRMWPSWNFPILTNFVHDCYKPGAYAHRAKLEQEKSPMLRSPFERGETFVRAFGDAFTVARMKDYAAIVHTGSVGRDDPGSGRFHFSGPLGFGGGQLSAFWTPSTGSVILGRRRGQQWEKNFDKVEDWHRWPIHAVSGAKAEGKIFTSARIVAPRVESDIRAESAVLRVAGIMPRESLGQGKVLAGRIEYQRVFRLGAGSVGVHTAVRSFGQDTIAELYETIPVFLRETGKQRKADPTQIEFVVAGKRVAATAEWTEGVTAIRLARFDGAAQIAFEQPQRVRLSEKDWVDTYLSRAACRNILVDLLRSNSRSVVLSGEKTVSYQIWAAAKPEE